MMVTAGNDELAQMLIAAVDVQKQFGGCSRVLLVLIQSLQAAVGCCVFWGAHCIANAAEWRV